MTALPCAQTPLAPALSLQEAEGQGGGREQALVSANIQAVRQGGRQATNERWPGNSRETAQQAGQWRAPTFRRQFRRSGNHGLWLLLLR